MLIPPLYYFPILAATLMPFTIILTYTIAVLLKHTEVDWPYISDTSAYPPESCIFGQLVNICALIVAIVIYIRYKQVREFYLSHEIPSFSHSVNKAGLWLGWLGSLGLSIVANFQETAVFKVHLTGAILAFGIGSVYLWTQVYASFKLVSITHGEITKHFRTFIAVVSTLGFVIMLVTGEIASTEFHGKDPSKWHPKDGGWKLHVASTASEWIVALCFNLFILTYIKEFKQISLVSPRIDLRINRVNLLFEVEEHENTFRATYAESILSAEETQPISS